MPYEIDEDLAYIYDKSLMYGEHTWGLANQHFVPGLTGKDWYKMYVTGLDPAYARMKESWKEHIGYIEDAEQALRRMNLLRWLKMLPGKVSVSLYTIRFHGNVEGW